MAMEGCRRSLLHMARPLGCSFLLIILFLFPRGRAAGEKLGCFALSEPGNGR